MVDTSFDVSKLNNPNADFDTTGVQSKKYTIYSVCTVYLYGISNNGHG